jgi:hypothetical protein
MRSIGNWLASEESGTAFCHCISCRLPLLEIAAPWLVNKEYHRGECVLEYAICQPCRNRVTEEFSEESKETVRSFLENRVDWQERFREFMMQDDLARRFDSCAVCGTPRDGLEGFGLSAFFDPAGRLVESALPLLICGACVGEATADLSKATRESWQRFLEEHFDGPPGLTERLPDGGLSGLL